MKTTKGKKTEPVSYWAAYYRSHSSKYKAWAKAYRDRKKAERKKAR